MRKEGAQPATLDDMAYVLNRYSRSSGWGVLTWMAEAGFVTTDQIALRFYPTVQGVRSATYRLDQLATWGVITRRYLRRKRNAWHLTELGARLVADHLTTTPRDLGWDGREQRVHEAYVAHQLAVTQFEVALRIHAARNNGEVIQFLREPLIETEAGTLRPDALLGYQQGNRTWWYALEMDMGTERPVYFTVTKIPRYERLPQVDLRLLCDELPTCLVVCAAGGSARASRLKTQIDQWPAVPGAYRLFKLASADDLYQIPQSRGGLLPEVVTRFNESTCLAAMKDPSERRAVFG